MQGFIIRCYQDWAQGKSHSTWLKHRAYLAASPWWRVQDLPWAEAWPGTAALPGGCGCCIYRHSEFTVISCGRAENLQQVSSMDQYSIKTWNNVAGLCFDILEFDSENFMGFLEGILWYWYSKVDIVSRSKTMCVIKDWNDWINIAKCCFENEMQSWSTPTHKWKCCLLGVLYCV